MSTDPQDRTSAPFGWGELDTKMQRTARRPQPHPRHDEVRALLLTVPAAKGGHSTVTYRLGDHYTLFADGRVLWEKPERTYRVNDWWTDDAGRIWAIDDGALDGVLHGLANSRRGIDGFIEDLADISNPQEPEPDDDEYLERY